MSAIPTAVVRHHQGAPTLFLNGEPHTGLMFWHSKPQDAAIDIQLFAEAGVPLFTTGVGGMECFREDGSTDFSRIDTRMRIVLDANPDALVMPRFSLNPPTWWLEKYPDEVQVHLDAYQGDEIREFGSFASLAWREFVRERIPTLLEYYETHWAAHIFAYHPNACATGEWAYRWGTVISGYSPVQQARFRDWLRERYGADDALRKAWNQPDVSLETAEVPRDRVREPRSWPPVWSFFDPATERQQIDYLIFHSQVVADAIVDYAQVAKDTLRRLGREKLWGVFYGYHFANIETAWVPHNAGHHAMETLLASPDIDFLSVPLNYNERGPGGTVQPRILPGGTNLYNKLYYNEDDTFTHLAKDTPYRYVCKTAAETAEILWRNFIATVCDGGTLWWMDHDGDGWYRDDLLKAEVKNMRLCAEDALKTDKRSRAQIAVVGSPLSQCHLRYDPALVDALWPYQLGEIDSIGAPRALFRITDLDRLLDQPWAAQYRLFIFPDALAVTEEQRCVIQDRLAQDGRTLLWLTNAGSLTESAVSAEAMADLTGIRTRLVERTGAMMAETSVPGYRITWGTKRHAGPVFVGDDPDSTVRGWTFHKSEPALVEKRFPTHRSLYCAVPTLPAAVLRALAREAGVHIYSERGDRIYATQELLGVHTVADGARTIRLPETMDLHDIRADASCAKQADAFDLDLPRNQTRVYRITAS